MTAALDARLILRDEELDAGLELMIRAEAAFWNEVDFGLAGQAAGLGRSHWRTAFLLQQHPGLGVAQLARLSGLSKQAASRTLSDLAKAGLVMKDQADDDGRRRPAHLTPAGANFAARIADRLRPWLAKSYRTGGLDSVGGTRRILTAMAEVSRHSQARGEGLIE